MKHINRRISSILRDNMVHDIYKEEWDKLGDMAVYTAKVYFYERIKERTGLSERSISFILNHTVKRDVID